MPLDYPLDGTQRANSLPLTTVSFDQYLLESELEEGDHFPPNRFAARDQRFSELESIYEGDYAFLVEDADLVAQPVGLARRLATVQSDVLLMSEPETAAEGLSLREPAADAVRDMLAYGGAIIVAVVGDEGGTIYTESPNGWYPLENDGAVLIRPFTSTEAETPDPDRVGITIAKGGTIERRVYEWKPSYGQTGEIGVLQDTEAIGDGQILISPRRPRVGIWGQSIYLDLTAPLLELSKRHTQNSKILDKNANPAVVVRMQIQDAHALFPIEDDQQTQTDAIVKGLVSLIKNDVIHLYDRLQDVEYLEFTGNLEASFSQVESTRKLIASLSGLPAILEGFEGAPPSGVSLRLQYLPFYAATSALQRDLADVLMQALEVIGEEPELEWPHIFDLMDDQAKQEMDAEMAQMESENVEDDQG